MHTNRRAFPAKAAALVLLTLITSLTSCSDQQPPPRRPKTKQYWLLKMEHQDRKTIHSDTLIFTSISVIRQIGPELDERPTFDLDTGYGVLTISRSLQGIRALAVTGVHSLSSPVPSASDTAGEVRAVPQRNMSLSLVFWSNEMDKSGHVVAGSVPLFATSHHYHYQDDGQEQRYTTVEFYLDGLSSAGPMRVPLSKVVRLEQKVELVKPPPGDPSQFRLLVRFILLGVRHHPELSITLSSCVLVLLIIAAIRIQKSDKERRTLELERQDKRKQLLSSPAALDVLDRKIESIFDAPEGAPDEVVRHRVSQIIGLRRCGRDWRSSISQHIRTESRKRIQAAEEKLLKQSLDAASYADWFKAARDAKRSQAKVAALRLIHDAESQVFYGRKWSEKQIEGKQRSLAGDAEACAALSQKGLLEFLLPFETALEWAIREHLIDSGAELDRKQAHLKEELQKVRNVSTLNAYDTGDLKAAVNIAPDSVSELDRRASLFYLVEKNLNRRNDTSVENLAEELTRTRIRYETEEVKKKMGKGSISRQAQELKEIKEDFREAVKQIAGADEDLAADIKEVYRDQRNQVLGVKS